jgi:hypothetical protein
MSIPSGCRSVKGPGYAGIAWALCKSPKTRIAPMPLGISLLLIAMVNAGSSQSDVKLSTHLKTLQYWAFSFEMKRSKCSPFVENCLNQLNFGNFLK